MSGGQNRRVFAGFALLFGIAALLVIVFLADRIRSAFQKSYALYAVFPSAARLRVGSPVWIGGHEVGQVVSIGFQPVRPDSSPSIAVRVEIPRKHQPLIRRTSTVRLASARLIGEPAVDILPGDPAAPVLQDGDTLYARPSLSAAQLMTSTTNLTQSLDSLLASSRDLSAATARSRAQFARIAVRIDQVQADFTNLKQNMSGSSVGLMINDSALKHTFAQAARTSQQLSAAFQTAAQRYTDPELRQAFSSLQQRAAALSTQLGQLRERFANGSLTRFTQDTAIMKALHAAQAELDSLVEITRRNPLRFWFGDRRPGVADPLRRD